MKKYLCFLLIVFLPCFCFCFVHAEDGIEQKLLEESVKTIEKSGVSVGTFSFDDAVQKISEGKWDWSLSGILERLSNLFFAEVKANISALVQMIVIAVFAGILCNLQGSFNREGIAEVSFLVCFIVIAGLSVSVFEQMVNTAETAIDSLNLFVQALIPPLTGVIAIGGAASGVSVSSSLLICMQVITYLSKSLFLPCILMITALSVVNNMTERFHITKLIEFARQALKWSSGILMTVFVGILSLQGFSSAFVSGVTGKTVKYAIRNFVPLVGSVLAESVDAVCFSAQVIQNALGTAGILALLSICLGPLMKLLVLSLLYRFAAGIAEPATDQRIVSMLGDLASNITQVFVILLAVCLMFIISVAILCAVSAVPMFMS